MMGKRLHLMQPEPATIYELNLLHKPPGIYLIRVMMDADLGMVKVVKNEKSPQGLVAGCRD